MGGNDKTVLCTADWCGLMQANQFGCGKNQLLVGVSIGAHVVGFDYEDEKLVWGAGLSENHSALTLVLSYL